jgi:putative transposase
VAILREADRDAIPVAPKRHGVSEQTLYTWQKRFSERGAPLYLRSDNGPEFVSQALLKWIIDQGMTYPTGLDDSPFKIRL